MRLLFISRWFPYPQNNGSKIRIFNLIKHLSSHHDITLLSFSQEDISEEQLQKMKFYCSSVHSVPYREFRPTRLKALSGFFSTFPRSFVDTYNKEMDLLIKKISETNNFDVVVASEIDTVRYALLTKNIPLFLEDLELSVICERYTTQSNFVLKARYGLTWYKLSRFIAKILQKFAVCTVVSKEERELVAKINPGYDTLAVVPNGVDLEANTCNFVPPQPGTLIYSGALTYHANFDAMEFFLHDILPRIKSMYSDVHLRITGSHDGVPINRLPVQNGVELTGYIADIRQAIALSWVCIVPLRIGGGTRIKILEAMAIGTPVISTTKGAAGLEVTHGYNILIADEPDDFAQSVVSLLKDKSVRDRLSKNGRQLVEERYSWEISAQRLEKLLRQSVRNQSNLNSIN
jgi:glycosyltransferase involved in cell wall biosynthesis